MPTRDYRAEYEQMVAEVKADPRYQARMRRDEAEAAADLARQRRARMRRMAWRAVQALNNPKLAGAVEQEIRQVGAGVQALAVWEAALRAQRNLTRDEYKAVEQALSSTPVDWALRKANDVIDQAERAVPLKHGGRGERTLPFNRR